MKALKDKLAFNFLHNLGVLTDANYHELTIAQMGELKRIVNN